MKKIDTPLFFIISLAISLFIFVLLGAVLRFSGKSGPPEIQTPKTRTEPTDAAKKTNPQPNPPSPNPRKTPQPSTSPSPAVPPSSDPADASQPKVRYSNQGFSPLEISIKSTPENRNCLLKITNESDKPLTVRLSPHHPQDDWGTMYAAIAARNTATIDPRYRVEKIAFHNFEKPEHEFSVILDPRCMPQ